MTTQHPPIVVPPTGDAAAREPLQGQAARSRSAGVLPSDRLPGRHCIAVLWTIPTFGLFVNSFRSKQDAATTGWWDVLRPPAA